MDQIIEMSQKIVENGYGYGSNGSVYFDTIAFHGKNEHFYAKLEPTSKGVTDLQEESEGKITNASCLFQVSSLI